MSVQLLGVSFFSKSKDQLLKSLDDQLQFGKGLVTIATPNAEQLVQASDDPSFRQTLSEFKIRIPDGSGPVMASQFVSYLKKRAQLKSWIPGVDVVRELLNLKKIKPNKCLIVGGRNYEGLVCSGSTITSIDTTIKNGLVSKQLLWAPGYESVQNPTQEEEEKLQKSIMQLRPLVVFVAFGAPWQEQWVISHQEFLEKHGVKIALVVGGAFDMLTGLVPRAPEWMRTIGLEWLFRLYQQPWRWRRQLRLVRFCGLVVRELF